MGDDLLREVLDSLTDPIVVLKSVRDETGAVVDFAYRDANEAACVDNRLARDDLIGQRLLTLFPHHGPSGLFAQYAAVADTQVPLRLNDQQYEHEFHVGEERYFDIRCAPVDDGVTLTWRDVTDRHLARRELQGSQARFRNLAEHASDVVYFSGPDQVIRWVSPSVTSVLGWPSAEVIGRRGADFLHPDDAEATESERLSVYGGGVDAQPFSTSAPVRVRTRAGDYRWMAGSLTWIPAEGTEPEGVVASWRDVEALVRAAAELGRARDEAEEALAAEARTRLSMDEAAIGLVVARLDGTIDYANPAMHRMVRATDGDLVGRSVERGAGQVDLDNARAAVARIVDGRSASEHLRRALTDVAGSRVWADAYLSPIRGASGDVDAILIQVVDVTAEVANRDSLARSMEHYRLLAENASDVVYETDAHGMIVWVSPSVRDALGWQPEELLGTRAVDLVLAEDLPLAERERAEVYGGGIKENVRVRFRTVDGAVRTMSVSARPIRAGAGVVSGAVVGLRDVSDEVAARRALERSERLFRVAMEEAPTGMALSDPADVIVEANPVLARLLGQEPEDLEGHRLRDFLRHGEESDPTCAEILVATGETRIENHEHAVLDPTQATEWIAHSVSVVRDRAGAPLFFVHQVADITATKRREEDLGYRASHDLLTGLLNRAGLQSRLTEWMPDEGSTARLALLYCDVDRLKTVNDTHGHAAGDIVLTETAHRMRAAVRRGDIVARISGDEFIIVLDRIQDEDDALAVAEKVRAEVHGPVAVPEGEVLITISVGIAVSAAGDDAQDVMARADEALYRAKVAGRDRVST